MHATGIHPFAVHVDGMLHAAGVSLELGGNVLVHPSGRVAIEKVVLNCDPPRIWAEAGVTNRQLNAELKRHGLTMPWNVVLENVRVAGIVSVGTHGSGKDTSTVGDLIDALHRAIRRRCDAWRISSPGAAGSKKQTAGLR